MPNIIIDVFVEAIGTRVNGMIDFSFSGRIYDIKKLFFLINNLIIDAFKII